MGIPGVGEIHPGSHVCALYSGPAERDRLLVSFMQEGLRHGDRCVCLVDDLVPAGMRKRAYGPTGPGDTHRSGHLGVYPASDVLLRAGEFSAEQMLSFLAVDRQSSAEVALALLRVAGEMSWVQQEPSATELSVYEAAVDRVLVDLPALFLCMYDLQQVGVTMLVNVLSIHSTVLLGGAVLRNPHRVAPIDYQPSLPAAARYPLARRSSVPWDGGDLWLSLTGAEVRLADLVASGMTNRAMATELIISPHTVDAHLKHIYLKLGIHSRVELTVLALQHGSPVS
jgi:DNA-binding CsgD family transcriptional regulator